MSTALLQVALDRGAAGERLDRAAALAVAEVRSPDDLQRIGRAAFANRARRYDRDATYVFNLHVNPSNLCIGTCSFCHYAARPGDAHAYELTEEEILRRVADLAPVEVHIVGGLNDRWGYARNLALVETLRTRYPDLHLKGFTATEIDYFARREGLTTTAVLTGLQAAGLDAMPGGGAEIFSDRIWQKYCPTKLGPDGWLAVHREAHGLGMTTNATMLSGLGETPAERVEHLLRLRELQDETGGFACFIPLAYLPGRDATPEQAPSPLEQLALIALARLTLDNIPHVKAYWPMIGLETAAAGLSWGADDLDGTLGDERIAQASGAKAPRALVRDSMEETIRLAGFSPVERDGVFGVFGDRLA